MNILAIDTATDVLSLALQVNAQRYCFQAPVGNKASEQVLPQIQALLDSANVQLTDLDGIAFGAGPGAFTGVRIACGVAQGLGFGANLPVVGVNTLLALAEATGESRVIACLDARMGEIYHAAFEKVNGAWQEVSATQVCKPEAAPQILTDSLKESWAAAGSGWAAYGDQLREIYAPNLSNIMTDITPSAEAILQLALPTFTAGLARPASEAAPIYVRNRVALTTAEREQGQRL